MKIFNHLQNNQTSPEMNEDYAGVTAEVRDLIAPASIKVARDYISLGSKYAQTLFVTLYPRYLDSNWLSVFVNLQNEMDISLYIHPAKTHVVLTNLRRKVAQVESQININTQKGLPRDPVLETAITDIEGLRDTLQQGTERFFRFGCYITVYADSKKELRSKVQDLEALLKSSLIDSRQAYFQTSVGFNSTSPLAKDSLYVHTNMNTSPLSTSFPFVSSDISEDKGVLYGINQHNNSLVIFDRFNLPNANSVVFATSGAGKSYAVKLEVLRSMIQEMDTIIIDPEREYKSLCEALDGEYIDISLTSKDHINPFDLIKPGYVEDDLESNILKESIVNLTNLIRLMLGGLTPEEEAIMDQALKETYSLKDITEESGFKGKEMPRLSDLAQVLAGMVGGESLSTRIQKYTTGSFAGFLNNETNVDVSNRLVAFNIRDMNEELRPVAMYLVLNYIWNVVRSQLKKRMLVVDEAWVMMKHEDAARFMHDIVKRARKYYLGVTTITQDVVDFLSSPYGQPIVTNSFVQLLLRQSPASIEAVSYTFNLTQPEKYLLLEAPVGEGIFFVGENHVAMKVVASPYEHQLVTTKPEEVLGMYRE